jgi:hypothetical protein
MTIDLTKDILDSKGNIAVQKYSKTVEIDGVEKEVLESQNVTVGRIIADCVLYEVADPKNITEEEHLLRYDIFERVKNAEQIEFNSKELDFIKSLIITRCMPIFAGQILRELNK